MRLQRVSFRLRKSTFNEDRKAMVIDRSGYIYLFHLHRRDVVPLPCGKSVTRANQFRWMANGIWIGEHQFANEYCQTRSTCEPNHQFFIVHFLRASNTAAPINFHSLLIRVICLRIFFPPLLTMQYWLVAPVAETESNENRVTGIVWNV